MTTTQAIIGGVKASVRHAAPLSNGAGRVEVRVNGGREGVAFGEYDRHSVAVPYVHMVPSEAAKKTGITTIKPGAARATTHESGREGVQMDTNKGKKFFVFDTNPGLRELVDNAAEIEKQFDDAGRDADAGESSAVATRDAAAVAQLDKDEAKLVSKIPTHHQRLKYVETSSEYGLGHYLAADGTRIPDTHPAVMKHGAAKGLRHFNGYSRYSYRPVASIPATAVDEIKGQEAAVRAGKVAATDAEKKRVADLHAKARDTGKDQEIDSWSEEVDEDDNSLNIVSKMVRPDGTTYTRKTRTY